MTFILSKLEGCDLRLALDRYICHALYFGERRLCSLTQIRKALMVRWGGGIHVNTVSSLVGGMGSLGSQQRGHSVLCKRSGITEAQLGANPGNDTLTGVRVHSSFANHLGTKTGLYGGIPC